MFIHLIVGCMFSGKTTLMLSLLEKARKEEGKKVLLIKHDADRRYDESGLRTVTHMGDFAAADVVSSGKLQDLHYELADCTDVFIEEAHFFEGLVDFALEHVKKGIRVFVCGLMSKGTPSNDQFESMMALATMCEKISLLRARCNRCYIDNVAIFTRRRAPLTPDLAAKMKSGKFEKSLVGGIKDYASLCRPCVEAFDNGDPL